MAPVRWTPAVVVTVALSGGCDKSSEPESAPTTATPPTGAADEGEKADGDGAEDGDADDWTSTERILQQGDGTCWRHVSVRCPEGVMCNPPAPEQVDCPPELAGATGASGATGATGAAGPTGATDEPLSELKQGNSTIRVVDNGNCRQFFSSNCPEGARCNPPPPRIIPCPPELEAASAAAKAAFEAKGD